MTKNDNKIKARPHPTVLIVDDDPAVRNSLKFSLEIEGFAVRLYADGRQLLDDPQLPPHGCLIVDQVMPGMSGLDVLDAIRHRGISNPAVLITSNESPKVRGRAAMAGVAVIEKPFFGNELVESLPSGLPAAEPGGSRPRMTAQTISNLT
jgi:two-component system, LuxR family, response regulator FixJ